LGDDYKGDLLVEGDDMTYLARHWLDLQGFDVTKREDEKTYSLKDIQKAFFPSTPLENFIHNPHYFSIDEIRRELEDAKRKPEIKACPNPECRGDDFSFEQVDENSVYIACCDCGYCSPIGKTYDDAIRLHNLISGKGG
jgi:hypothetical protein